jgi:cytochrome c peroxidase
VPIPFVAKPNQYGQSSWNFSLFFGLALQVYQSTLVSDDTPFDRYLEGNTQALTARQIDGMNVFYSKGQCFACHSGPEFTNASVSHAALDRLEQMMAGSGFPPVLDGSGFINTSGRRVVYDAGFYNIGVRPSQQDLGLGANDPFGLPLSESRLFNQGKLAQLGLPLPDFQVEARRAASADGAFKTPSLRNVELTAPYFHNGGTLTLRQLVDFYNRRGDFTDANKADIPPDFVALGLTATEKDNLVHFLKALTDERVRHHRAPFDHPQLLLPNGHPIDAAGNVLTDRNGRALDNLLELPAAGRDGFQPLANFLNLQ